MQEVVLDGVTYTKAAAAAKQFKYTSDYIGQLCRAKKLDARLVGRTWYVNTDSIAAYQATKSSTTNSESIKSHVVTSSEDMAHSVKINRKRVEPVLATKTAKKLYGTQEAATSRTVNVSYSVDDAHLIPKIRTVDAPPRYVPLTPAGGQSLPVDHSESSTSFSPEELPDVALSGGVTVTDIPDEAEVKPKFTAQETIQETPKKAEIPIKNKAISVKLPIRKKSPPTQAVPPKQSVIRPTKKHITIPRTSKTGGFQSSNLPAKQRISAANVSTQRAKAGHGNSSDIKPQTLAEAQDVTAAKAAQVRTELRLDTPPATKSSATATPVTVTKKPASTAGSFWHFLLLLIIAIVAGLLVGYVLVISPSEYSVGPG